MYLVVGNQNGHLNSFEAALRLGLVPSQQWTSYNPNKYYFSFYYQALYLSCDKHIYVSVDYRVRAFPGRLVFSVHIHLSKGVVWTF